MSWADLSDARRSRRLVQQLDRSAQQQPSLSIPADCSSAAKIQAAYRLLSHEAIGWQDILALHLRNSLQHMKQEMRAQRLERDDRQGPLVISCGD